jgi:hypothetical protein
MNNREELVRMLQVYVAGDSREEADRCAMLRLAQELAEPLSRDEPSAHFTASAFVIDDDCSRTCLIEHAKLGRLLQPGGHLEPDDASFEAARRPRWRSSCIPRRRGRSTSTFMRSRGAPGSRGISTWTFGICYSGAVSRARTQRGMRSV